MEIPLRSATQAPSTRVEKAPDSSRRIEELSDSDGDYEDMGAATAHEEANIAYLNKVQIPIRDSLETETSRVQDETYDTILPFLEGNPNGFALNAYGLPKLQKEKHAKMAKNVLGNYPGRFSVMDASRPWLVYWGLQSMTALGQDIHPFQKRVAHTFKLVQHPTGGFGGGFGQLPHLACTYAGLLSFAMVGGVATYETVNRKTMWQYLGRMKQADGGFTMVEGGEEDIRGAFCAMVILSLLNLPLELPQDAPARAQGLNSFTDNLGEWVSKCQSWDGGISAAPGNEAHGAYAFCGLGCLSILGSPKDTLNKYLDLPLLVHWLTSRQCAPEGGYNGRTNKLVDGCYSHWVGGCWALIEAAVEIPSNAQLWNRVALGRYILAAAQDKGAGLRDKPGKPADGYHTCYNLAGLSAAQYKYIYDERVNVDIGKEGLGAPYHWKTNGQYEAEDIVWDADDVVRAIHPVFVIPFRSVYECRRYFEEKKGL